MANIFISYTSLDKPFKDKLLAHLGGLIQYQGFTVSSHDDIDVGEHKQNALMAKIGQADVSILLISANFLSDESIYQQQLPAIFAAKANKGTHVLPLICKPCKWQNVPQLKDIQVAPNNPKPLSTLSDSECDTQLVEFVDGIMAMCNINTTSLTNPDYLCHTPPAPKLFLGRENDLKQLKIKLLSTTEPLNSPQVVRGWPGIGKTSLLLHLCRDAQIQSTFSDGILWASLGQAPNILTTLGQWGDQLGDDSVYQQTSITDAIQQLRALITKQNLLLVVDDVWDIAHGAVFNQLLGEHCALVFSTRETEIARALGRDVLPLAPLSLADAMALLNSLAAPIVQTHNQLCQQLMQDVECLPLAIHVAAGILKAELELGFDVKALLLELREGAMLLKQNAPIDMTDFQQQTLPTVAWLFEKSTSRLTEQMRLYFSLLGVFAPKPATFDQAAMQAVLGVDEIKPVIHTLANRGLLEPVGDGRFQIHALLVAHAKTLQNEH